MILAIDQGTTATTCLVLDADLQRLGRGTVPLTQHFPEPGWVEQDPEEIWASVLSASEAALADAGLAANQLRAIGIANQRETTLLWDRATGHPVARAIVWQDRRTAERCRALPADLIRSRTGLVPDPYFSATKLEWLLERSAPPSDGLAFGTVDSWLVWKLTGGRIHATDVTNAARTMLLDLTTLDWDDELLGIFGVDRSLLPRICRSAEVVGEGELLGATLPIAGIAGDQQASLFGHGCFGVGDCKATYGTGSFVLVNVGSSVPRAPSGLLATAAATAPAAEPQYAIEGAVLASGASIQWLRDGLGLIADAAETEQLAESLDSNEGVFFVPALTGLGSPWWEPEARGLVCGLTRGTTRAHLARAALEGIAFQIADVVDAFPEQLRSLRADGGATANGFLMQFQANVLGMPIDVAAEHDTTALGAAALAGLSVGVWRNAAEVAELLQAARRYEPQLDAQEVKRLREQWSQALKRTRLGVDGKGANDG